ncbi:MAG: cobalamin B12-binding domain-containing protein [Pseudomonadota bacterium]
MFVSRTNTAQQDDSAAPGAGRGNVAWLAAAAVAQLAAREARTDAAAHAAADGQACARFAAALMAHLRRNDGQGLAALQADLRLARIGCADLVDRHVPQAARCLGQGWEDDDLSFAQVSMASARLQALVREAMTGRGAEACAPRSLAPARQAAVLVTVAGDDQHTLGAVVLTSQLRRRGVSVCLALQPTAAEVTALLRNRRFDGAMVSVGGQGRLACARNMIKLLKSLTDGQMQVAVGGAAMEKVMDLGAATGADLATNDVGLALRTLGLGPAASCATERV